MHAPVPQLRSLVELLNSGVGTVDDAARELGGTPDATTSAGRKFVQLPVAPSAYGMTWLFAPESVPLKWPESIAVLFNYTSQYPGTRHRESLDHWSSQVSEPWIVMVEGPVNRASGQYEMKADQPHEWADSIDAGHRVIEQFARGRDRVGYYFNSIVPLAFEIGVRSTMMSRRRRVYHFDARPATGQARYELVVDGWQ